MAAIGAKSILNATEGAIVTSSRRSVFVNCIEPTEEQMAGIQGSIRLENSWCIDRSCHYEAHIRGNVAEDDNFSQQNQPINRQRMLQWKM
jgi:hypothetical protein